MNVRRFFGYLIIACLLLSLFSCQGEEEKKDSEPIAIKAIHSYDISLRETDPRVNAWFTAIDEIKKQYPDVEFDFEYINHDEYQEKMRILSSSDNLPDIFDLKGSWVKSYVDEGLLLPLSGEINKDTNWKNSIRFDANKVFNVDGEQYGLCLEAGGTTHLVFYNKEILKEAGYERFPATYDEFKELITAVKNLGYTPLSMGNKGKWLAESCYLSVIGNRLAGLEWANSIIDRKGAGFLDKPFIDALTIMKELVDLGAFNDDFSSVTYKEQRIPYYQKKAAMFVEGFWAINGLLADAPAEIVDATEITIFPDLETGKGSPKIITGGTGAWAISLNAKLEGKVKEVAVDFLKTFVSIDSGNKLLAGGMIPAIKTGDFDKSALHRITLDYFKIMEEGVPSFVFDGVFDSEVIETMNNGLQEMLNGLITPEELAKNIQAVYQPE